ncbi:TPR repeat-containing protein [Methanocaldococcus villosus KIN24-T80]|uniref:TPR repeat-containing protein n=1 Tax=Methanocaldococcus villosus KIN24-T80 TaxID=1069083 RepID=N6VRX0_9EURY|nr:tetratricopeptide repeat protein [Methanocaldococcus villosus]ENN96615.1 TPR repeat-containing protein [Methanocaldococcus villosus KIN24-T80]
MNINELILNAIKSIDYGDTESAKKFIEKALELDPNNTLAKYIRDKIYDLEPHMGCCNFMLGNFERAAYTKDTFPEETHICFLQPYRRAMALVELGEYDKALKALDDLIKVKKDFVPAWRQKAVLLETLGRYEEALKCIDVILSLNSFDIFALYLKGKILKQLGRFKEALEYLYKAVNLNKDLILAYKDIAYCELIIGNYRNALEWLNKYLEKVPNDNEALFYLALAYEGLKEDEKAIKILDKVIKRAKNKNLLLYKNAILLKAKILERNGKLDEAIELYNKALEK